MRSLCSTSSSNVQQQHWRRLKRERKSPNNLLSIWIFRSNQLQTQTHTHAHAYSFKRSCNRCMCIVIYNIIFHIFGNSFRFRSLSGGHQPSFAYCIPTWHCHGAADMSTHTENPFHWKRTAAHNVRKRSVGQYEMFAFFVLPFFWMQQTMFVIISTPA